MACSAAVLVAPPPDSPSHCHIIAPGAFPSTPQLTTPALCYHIISLNKLAVFNLKEIQGLCSENCSPKLTRNIFIFNL